ncbi:MAG TPA: hypothetical protein GX736_00620 [Mogibacterium sp.]|nr:hypothetical protein [Mogibacterium sp.]
MKKTIIAIAMALVISLALLVGCGKNDSTSQGGVLVLSVNPEIAVEYDENGLVTGVTARNDDAKAIVDSCEDLVGKETRVAVTTLVEKIGDAGFFVEEIEGEGRKISIEIEEGSSVPNDTFLKDIISDVRSLVKTKGWKTPLLLKNGTDYGYSNYKDSDYDDSNYDNDSDYSDYDDSNYDNDSDYSDYDDSDYSSKKQSKPSKPAPKPAAPSNNSDYSDYSDYDDSDYDD